MNLHKLISDEFSEEGQQTSHHHHEKSKKVAAFSAEGKAGYRQARRAGSSLPYRAWPGQTAGNNIHSVSLLSAPANQGISKSQGLVTTVCRLGLSPKRNFSLQVYPDLATACCISMDGEHP